MDQRAGSVFADYGIGLLGGLCLGGLAWAVGEFVLGRLAQGAWSAALLSALAVLLLTAGVVVGVGEPLYRRARKRWNPETPQLRRRIYEAAFLGSPAVIALLSLIEMDWPSIMFGGGFSTPVRILLVVLGIVQYVITAPLRLLLALGVPAEVLILLAMPMGAVLALHVPALRKELFQTYESEPSGNS